MMEEINILPSEILCKQQVTRFKLSSSSPSLCSGSREYSFNTHEIYLVYFYKSLQSDYKAGKDIIGETLQMSTHWHLVLLFMSVF